MTNKNNRNTVIFIGSILVVMTSLAFASVPLYRIFCQKTGYGGTTQVGIAQLGEVRNRLVKVRFNADVNTALPWRFVPLQNEILVKVGEVSIALYQAENLSDNPVKGMAVYNVTPDKAGIYFNKIDCFCFIEQTLQPHQIMDMPVQFFIDPKFADDASVADITTITLSYTFFPFKN